MKNLISHPLIKFPEPVEKRRVIKERGERKEGMLDTRECARLFGGSVSNARQLLKRWGVRCCCVQVRGVFTSFWDEMEVKALLEKRGCVGVRRSPGYVSIEEAMGLVGCVRSSVQRLAKAGRIGFERARMRSAKGMRVHVFYRRCDCIRLGMERSGVDAS